MAQNCISIVYGFKRSSDKQPCMREYITDNVYAGDSWAFERNYFSTTKESPIEWVADWASGRGDFELLGLLMSHCHIKDHDKFNALLKEKVENAGLDYDTLVEMYGEPELHVEHYMY